LLRKIFFSKNFEALHQSSAKRYGDSADEIFAGVGTYKVMVVLQGSVPRLMQRLGKKR
jgi:deoxyadenosine/deoxycytidine kinase